MAKSHQNITQAYTVSTTAVDLSTIGYTAAQLAGAVRLVVTSDQLMRYLGNGTTPTSTLGHLIPANETVVFDGDESALSDLQFIRDGASDCVCTFELETFEEV